MKRMDIYITERQDEALRELAKETGLQRSEYIRRALDDYLKRIRKEKQQ